MTVELSTNISGLFCVHLLRTFIQIQIERIPESYILRRHTKFARRDLEFDRHDKVLEGEDGNTRMYRSKMLLTKAMRAIEDSLHWMSCAKSLNYSPMTLDHEHGGGNHQQLQRCVVGFDHCKCVHFIDLYITQSFLNCTGDLRAHGSRRIWNGGRGDGCSRRFS